MEKRMAPQVAMTNYTSKGSWHPAVLPSLITRYIFDGLTAANGSELWVTDGTDAALNW